MTTIAYNHKDKEIAWDSRRTSGGLITDDDCSKHLEKDGVIFWLTGSYSDRERFVEYYFGAKHEFIPACNAFVFDSGRLFYCGVTDVHELWREPVEANYASGSGGDFALAAMDFGCSAKDAVKYAKTRDCYTGGKVKVFKVE